MCDNVVLFLFIVVSFAQICYGLHCKDVDNKPVDWWYIYKPPRNLGHDIKPGVKFVYITSKQDDRWMQSPLLITAKDSMLDFTLAPFFRVGNNEHLAKLVYHGRNASYLTDGSSAFGVLMADQLGGVWVTHTVPDLIDMKEKAFKFPSKETNNGHLLMCLSIDLIAVNGIGKALRRLSLDILKFSLPASVMVLLPDWHSINTLKAVKGMTPQKLSFLSRNETVQVEVLLRPPGSKLCLYNSFSKYHSIVMDVYRHAHKTACAKEYSVRNIETISLKVTDKNEALPTVCYINKNTDKMGFAVSTAAHWQKRGNNPNQYWTCFSSVEHQNFAYESGLIVCVNNYVVWWNFDNFKVKEPTC